MGMVMPWIFWTIGWLFSIVASLSKSQVLLGWMKSATLAWGLEIVCPSKLSSPIKFLFLIQLANHKEILSPFPNFQIILCFTMVQHFNKFFQTGESVFFPLQVRKSLLWRYLALMAWTQMLDLLVRICHANLHWSTLLTAFVCRNPSFPCSLVDRVYSTQWGVTFSLCYTKKIFVEFV